LVQLGYAKSCTSFAGYSDALGRLQKQPVMVGMNWYSSMFSTNNCGGMTVSGTLEGGHEPEIVGYDAGNKRVWLQNSWGNSWGVCLGTHCGYFYLSVNDLAGSKLDAEFDAPDAP
jgi:C1A family cysteine protease